MYIYVHLCNVHLYVYLCNLDIYVKEVKLATVVESDPKALFLIATTPRYRGGRHSFPLMAIYKYNKYRYLCTFTYCIYIHVHLCACMYYTYLCACICTIAMIGLCVKRTSNFRKERT